MSDQDLIRDLRDALESAEGCIEQDRGVSTDGPDADYEELIARADAALGEPLRPSGWSGGHSWKLNQGWRWVDSEGNPSEEGAPAGKEPGQYWTLGPPDKVATRASEID